MGKSVYLRLTKQYAVTVIRPVIKRFVQLESRRRQFLQQNFLGDSVPAAIAWDPLHRIGSCERFPGSEFDHREQAPGTQGPHQARIHFGGSRKVMVHAAKNDGVAAVIWNDPASSESYTLSLHDALPLAR